MKTNKDLQNYITISDEILGDKLVFKNTRVPVQILFDYLKEGKNLQEFLENYPTVLKSVAKQVLQLSKTSQVFKTCEV